MVRLSYVRFGVAWCIAIIIVSGFSNAASDNFYTPKNGWRSSSAGDILAWRSIDASGIKANVDLTEAYQILYRTSQNSPKNPQHSVTTILVPKNSVKNKLVVVGEAQDSNNANSAPSVGFVSGSRDSPNLVVDESLLVPYLQAGYIVTVPDSEGPLNAFTAGRSGGYQTLDSIRATLSFDKLSLNKNTTVAGFGYSGGGQAISWAAALQQSYAPEIHVAGWAFGGFIPNVTALMHHADSSLASGYAASAITGLVDAYPDLEKTAKSLLTSDGQDMLDFVRSNPITEVVSKYAKVDVLGSKFFKRDGGLFLSKAYRDVARQNMQGTSQNEVPHVPLYVYHAESDEVVPYNSALQTVQYWCRHGAKVEFVTYTDDKLNHNNTQVTGSQPVFTFIQRLLNGKKVSWDACSFVKENTGPSASSSAGGPHVVPIPTGGHHTQSGSAHGGHSSEHAASSTHAPAGTGHNTSGTGPHASSKPSPSLHPSTGATSPAPSSHRETSGGAAGFGARVASRRRAAPPRTMPAPPLMER